MFLNLNYLLIIILIILKCHLINGQSYEQGSYEEMDPDSREEQIYKPKSNGDFVENEQNEAKSNDGYQTDDAGANEQTANYERPNHEKSNSHQSNYLTPQNYEQLNYEQPNFNQQVRPENPRYRSPFVNP